MNIVHLTGLQPGIQRDQLLDYPYDGASDISPDKAFLPQVALVSVCSRQGGDGARVESFLDMHTAWYVCLAFLRIVHSPDFPGFSALAAFAAWGSCTVKQLPLIASHRPTDALGVGAGSQIKLPVRSNQKKT